MKYGHKKNRLELQDGSKTTNYNHMNFQNLIGDLFKKQVRNTCHNTFS